tara:strand:+ start:2420 stop:3085 length:666 start_codon:yes stop_codon:yes gene_type:complete
VHDQGNRIQRLPTLGLWVLPLVLALAIPGVGVLGSFGIVVAMLIFHRDARNATLRLWKRGPVTSLLIGLAVGVVTHFLMSALLEPALQHMLGQQVDLSQFDTVKNNLANYLVLLAIGLLFGGIVEELIFRGYIIGWGTKLLGARTGPILAVVSATVFGLAHSYQGVAGMLSTGLIGLIFGLTYLAVGRKLAPAIFAHMTINALGITELYLGHSFVAPLFTA